ncbi:GNAT family N-acetyltransferase [Acidithiobacillus sp. AMEEHan]|uniref:GNAT family N-acetyltransferase n=1 Tax=Acidithiobacillus sp. AMEEHan TaxID=2994951 RepID=UPI0027E51404|nr:GNAT family N-acetyltransferase [Acidithiobacillus sp. AMEEHan]
MQIRAAQIDDLPAILQLYAQPGMDDGKVLDVSRAESIFQRMQQYPNYRLFVAQENDNIVGSYALLIMDNLAHRGAPSAIVEDVVVSPTRHGQGIGKQMMRHAMNLAREAACYKLVLSSNAKRDAAHAFYKSLGFDLHGFSFRVDFES